MSEAAIIDDLKGAAAAYLPTPEICLVGLSSTATFKRCTKDSTNSLRIHVMADDSSDFENFEQSNRTGPIIFNHPVARRQLVERNVVVTFRESERTVGETWWRETRTGEKKGDCRVLFRGEADPSNDEHLKPFAH